LKMTDAASDIGTLASFARGRDAADRIAIQTAGRPNAGLQLAGTALSAAGSMGLSGAAGNSMAGWSGPTTSGANLASMGGGQGIKLPANLIWSK
jgi:hypothetical protein